MKTLYLIRGVPGSGKSTLAEALIASLSGDNNNHIHREADMFFEEETQWGTVYKFDKSKIHDAHRWCIRDVWNGMDEGVEVIIVSNTFVRQWELAHYMVMARNYSYTVVEIICKGNFQSIHNVPSEVVERMKREFEYV